MPEAPPILRAPLRAGSPRGSDAGATPAGSLPRWIVPLLVGLALLLLLHNLGHAFVLFMRAPLNPDVPGFLADARAMRFFYDCPTREPFHVLWLKIGLLFSEDAEAVARLASMVQTVLVALLLYAFGSAFFGRMAALAALILFCVNPVARFYGVSGLRDPLFAACLLLFALLLFAPPAPGRDTGRAVLAGVAGALLVLTRVYACAILAGAFLLYVLREKAWRPERRRPVGRRLLAAAVAAAALLVPDLLLRPPSPVHAQTVNLFRNLERTGEPGSWQTDPPVGHFQYLFGEHTLPEIVSRVAANSARYAWQYLPFWLRGYEILWVFLPVGIVAASLARRGFVAGLLALSIVHVVFVLHLDQVPGVRGIENRFVYQAFPLALLLLVHGVLFAAERLLRVAAGLSPGLVPLHARLAPLLLPPALRRDPTP